MFSSSPSSVNTSNTSFNMFPVKNTTYKNAHFSIERDYTTNTYNALTEKNKPFFVSDKLVLTDINGIANQIPEFKKSTAHPVDTKILNDDLNTKFFIVSITVLGLYVFYKMSVRH